MKVGYSMIQSDGVCGYGLLKIVVDGKGIEREREPIERLQAIYAFKGGRVKELSDNTLGVRYVVSFL